MSSLLNLKNLPHDFYKVLIILSFTMFHLKELRLMFNDPLDLLVNYLNFILLKNNTIKIIFS